MNNYRMDIERQCPSCGKSTILTVNNDDYQAWKSGKLIQDAFPYLNTQQRETLLSGFCGPCWDNLFEENDNV
jgi:hypothetical protein